MLNFSPLNEFSYIHRRIRASHLDVILDIRSNFRSNGAYTLLTRKISGPTKVQDIHNGNKRIKRLASF